MKTVLITGANRGLGLEHARRFAASGATVYAGAREPGKAEELQALGKSSPGKVVVFAYDAHKSDAAANAKKAVGNAPLDLLFANAGVIGGDHQKLGDIAADDFAETLQVNTVAPMLLANALLDNVAASEKKVIAFQSSIMGSNADSPSPHYYAYRASKAALNKIASTLAVDLKARGITVVTLHPGWVRTDMGGPNADISVEQSVDGQQNIFAGLSLAQSGRFFSYDGKPIAW